VLLGVGGLLGVVLGVVLGHLLLVVTRVGNGHAALRLSGPVVHLVGVVGCLSAAVRESMLWDSSVVGLGLGYHRNVGDVGLSGHGSAGLAVATSATVAVDDDGVDDEADEEHDELDAAQGGAGGDDGGIGGREAVKVVSIEDNIANGGIGSLDTEGHEPEEGEKDVEDENGPVVVGAGGARVSADKPDGDDEGDEGRKDHQGSTDIDDDGDDVATQTEEDDGEDELENAQHYKALGVVGEVLAAGDALGDSHCGGKYLSWRCRGLEVVSVVLSYKAATMKDGKEFGVKEEIRKEEKKGREERKERVKRD
jgi:hypothetical protein